MDTLEVSSALNTKHAKRVRTRIYSGKQSHGRGKRENRGPFRMGNEGGGLSQ